MTVNIRRKWGICWLPAFSSFPTMFLEVHWPGVVSTRDCVLIDFKGVIFLPLEQGIQPEQHKKKNVKVGEKNQIKLTLYLICQF